MTTPDHSLIDIDAAGMSLGGDGFGMGSPHLGRSATAAERAIAGVLRSVNGADEFDVDLLQELAMGVRRL